MDLKHTHRRVVVSVNLEGKNSHTFSNGLTIRLERQFDNLNRRETEPVNAIVISAENIPEGVEILVHQNAPTDVNRIFNHGQLSGQQEGSDVKYYSIPVDQCFLWRDKNDVWQPIHPYETALRVFESYKGILEGIDPKPIKNVLYVTSGELKNKVVHTLPASAFEVIFQGINGQEDRVIRFRPFGDEATQREPEAVAINDLYTKKVKKGELLIGLSVKDAKPLEIKEYAS